MKIKYSPRENINYLTLHASNLSKNFLPGICNADELTGNITEADFVNDCISRNIYNTVRKAIKFKQFNIFVVLLFVFPMELAVRTHAFSRNYSFTNFISRILNVYLLQFLI